MEEHILESAKKSRSKKKKKGIGVNAMVRQGCRDSLVRVVIASCLFVASVAIFAKCPIPTPTARSVDWIREDGIFHQYGGLQVNSDGALASYTVGDHGFTYVANGVDLLVGDQWVGCKNKSNHCRKLFLEAESLDFGVGSRVFCAFGFAVADEKSAMPCVEGPKNKGFRIGGGLGKPKKLDPPLQSADGKSLTAYSPSTRLTHVVGGNRVPIDSMTIPSLVAPVDRADLLGSVAWVRYRATNRSSLAIISDSGPALMEGSIALHQLLRHGESKVQKPGPISLSSRCQLAEKSIEAPFISSPDIAEDACTSSVVSRGATDIRAIAGIDSGVDVVVFSKAKLPMAGRFAVAGKVDYPQIAAAFSFAGYTSELASQIAECE